MHLDPQIIAKAIAGDRLAFEIVIEQTWGLVYVFVHQRVKDAELSRDLTQDTMLKAYTMRASLREANSLVGWLLTIAAHKIIDFRRRTRVRPEVALGERDVSANEANNAAGVADAPDELARLSNALPELDDLYRTVLILRYWSGMSPAQIARLLEEPEGTIRNRLFRAHFRLREILERQQSIDDGRPIGSNSVT